MFFRPELRYSAALLPNDERPSQRIPWMTLSQGTLLICFEVMSLLLGFGSLSLGDKLPAALASNQFPPGSRELSLQLLLIGFSLSVGLGALIAKKWGAERLLQAAQVASPLIPLGMLPGLLCTKYWFNAQLDYLVTLATVGLLTEATLRPSFAFFAPILEKTAPDWLKRGATGKWFPLSVVCTASLAYIIVSAHLTIMDHYRFGTGAFDLGIFDNVMWNTLHGAPFQCSIYGPGNMNMLAVHSEFAMVLFAPLYALWPRAEGLLALQALALGGAAIPLYFLAKTRLGELSSCLIALLYLLYAPVHGAQEYDFHWLPMAIPFLFLLFYAISAGKKWLAIPTALLLFALREDIAPGLAVVGVILLVTGTRPVWGLVLAGSAALWFVLIKFVIMPQFGTALFAGHYSDLAAPGEPGFSGVFKTLLSNPLFVFRHLFTTPKFTYLLHILVPLALLPVRRPVYLLFLLPGIFFTVLTNWSATYSLKYHYSTHFIPYVFAAAVVHLGALSKQTEGETIGNRVQRSAPAALGAMTLVMVCHSVVFGFILVPSSFIGGVQPVSYTMTRAEKERLSNLEKLRALIPPNASVSATDWDVPHLSNRARIYAVAQRRDDGKYLFVSTQSLPLAQTKQNVHWLLENHPYGFVAEAGTMTLWKKGHTPTDPKRAAEAKARLYRQISPRKHKAGPPKRPRPRSEATP